ncbi:MAG: glycosyltransferase [Chloroflexi bacterium]|nr:glycosyltransferase [Chloroflexota bacterium]
MQNVPRLTELPPPPPGKTGWPWTEECEHLNDDTLPRVSIVTPSFNQGAFIEETIRSVLLQGYPNLEYIIIDGGSTDDTIAIIRKYERWLAYWVSEPDCGQVDAVDKGWAKSSGTILAYINSDDTYLPNALANVMLAFAENPGAAAVCGSELVIDTSGIVITERFIESVTLNSLLHFNFVPQPSIFLRRTAFEQAGGLDLNFQVAFDYELWTRLVRYGGFHCITTTLATTRWHSSAKTFAQRPRVLTELRRTVDKVLASPAGQTILAEEQRAIQAGLNFLAVSIFLDNPFQNIARIIANTIRAVAQSPARTPQLIRLFGHRARVLLAYYWLKYGKQKNVAKTPWGFGYTGIHWSEWHHRHENNTRIERANRH